MDSLRKPSNIISTYLLTLFIYLLILTTYGRVARGLKKKKLEPKLEPKKA